MSFTQDPWQVEHWFDLDGKKITQVAAFEESGNRSLAVVVSDSCNPENVEGNATLMASAPALLKALQAMYEEFGNDKNSLAKKAIENALKIN